MKDQKLHSVVGIVFFLHLNLNKKNSSMKWKSSDGFPRQQFVYLPAWVGYYPEQVIVAQVTYGSTQICEMAKVAPIRYSTSWRLDNSRHQHGHLELLKITNMDDLLTPAVYPIHNQFWEFPLCNNDRLWQLAELHQLLLTFVKDSLHHISKMNFSHWKPPGVAETIWSVNLNASISEEYYTLGGQSGWPSEKLRSVITGTGVPWEWVWKVSEHHGVPDRTLSAPGSM